MLKCLGNSTPHSTICLVTQQHWVNSKHTDVFLRFQFHSLFTAYCTFHSDANGLGYRRKAECQNITALSCDLTAETPSLHDVHYWARVLVNGRLHGNTTTRFKPIAESKNVWAHFFTSFFYFIAIAHLVMHVSCLFCVSVAVLGPPILSMDTTVSSLHVNVTLPLGPNGVSIRDIITRSNDGPNKHMICYILKITHPEWAVQVSLHSAEQNTV